MCGILGITIADFNEGDYDLIRNLFQQSMIRGKHATGVSYVKNGKVHTVKEPIPADEFISKQNLEDWKNEDGHLYCVGHIRYSTSDLRYNQPFSVDELGIVHNGVISQEPPITWVETYGIKTETSNDSELVLRALESPEHKHPLVKFHPASMAVCTLTSNKVLSAFRNHERPLWFYAEPRMTIFASTADILKRSNIFDVEKTEMYRIYTVEDFTFSSIGVETNVEDLQ